MATEDTNNPIEEVIIVSQDSHGEEKVTIVEVVAAGSDETHVEVIEAILDVAHVDHEQDHAMADHADTSGHEPDFAGADHSDPGTAEGASPSLSASDAGDHSDDGSQAHLDAAEEAQSKADDAVAAGDYESAAQFREDAENEAGLAGHSDMLHGSTSDELQSASDLHDQAQQYEQQEAKDIQSGDYEAARDDAAHAASATSWADQNAGGADHTGQAQGEYNQTDWAVWEQHSGNEDAQSAEAYAATGDADHASQYSEHAADHYDAADYHADLGEHDGAMASHDSSSDVADAGSYAASDSHESAAVDTHVEDTSSSTTE